MNTLLIFPLKQELEFFISNFKSENILITKNSRNESVYFVKKWHAYLCIGGHGKTTMGIMTSLYSTELLSITKIILLGSAGSLTKSVKKYDVVIGDFSIEHDYNVKFIKNIKLPLIKRSIQFNKNKFSHISNIHFGGIASGDEDIIDKKRSSIIFNKTKSLAVAWEGIGAAKAAKILNISFIEIRGITDNCDNSFNADFYSNLKVVMSKLFIVAKSILE